MHYSMASLVLAMVTIAASIQGQPLRLRPVSDPKTDESRHFTADSFESPVPHFIELASRDTHADKASQLIPRTRSGGRSSTRKSEWKLPLQGAWSTKPGWPLGMVDASAAHRYLGS